MLAARPFVWHSRGEKKKALLTASVGLGGSGEKAIVGSPFPNAIKKKNIKKHRFAGWSSELTNRSEVGLQQMLVKTLVMTTYHPTFKIETLRQVTNVSGNPPLSRLIYGEPFITAFHLEAYIG